MNFKNPERVMQIQHFHPGHTIDEIKENTGFDLRVAPDASETPVPNQDVLKLIAEIDRDGVRHSEFH
jgi:glutaconate CoA-transferase subunit B